MTMEITISTITQLREATFKFVSAMGDKKVFALYGKMGVGKTTFTKAVCEELGVSDVVNSPSFSIVNEYKTSQGNPIYHFDFYRIRQVSEALDIGCQDYFASGNLCFIEWPEMIEPLLPPDAVKVTIEEMTDGSRKISF